VHLSLNTRIFDGAEATVVIGPEDNVIVCAQISTVLLPLAREAALRRLIFMLVGEGAILLIPQAGEKVMAHPVYILRGRNCGLELWSDPIKGWVSPAELLGSSGKVVAEERPSGDATAGTVVTPKEGQYCLRQISKTKFCHKSPTHAPPCDEDGDCVDRDVAPQP
jgi:hypothetical protein